MRKNSRLTLSLAACLSLGSGALVRGSDYVVVDRGSNELVVFEDAEETCRYPEKQYRLSSGETLRRVLPLETSGTRLADVVYDTMSPLREQVILRRRTGTRGFYEGLVQEGRELVDALGVSDGLILVVRHSQPFEATLVRAFGSRDLGRARLADLAFDRDDRPWFAFWDDIAGEVTVESLHGDRAEAASVPLVSATWIGLGDLEDDGDLDLLAVSRTEAVSYENLGTEAPAAPSFGEPVVTTLPAEGVFQNVVPADADADGDLDLFVSGSHLLLGDGSGAFPRWKPPRFPVMFAIGDLNGDGLPDAVGVGRRALEVHENMGRAEFRRVQRISLPESASDATDLGLGDLDLDGDLDVVVAAGDLLTYHGREGHDFSSPQVFPAGGSIVDALARDVTGDGEDELIVLEESPDRIEVLTGRSRSRLEHDRQSTIASPERIFAEDIDGDGDADIVVSSEEEVHLLFGDGGGAFRGEDVVAIPGLLAAADIDGDRRGELIAVDPESGRLALYASDRGQDFTVRATFPLGREPVDALVADLDRDGRLDLSVANRLDSTVSFFRGLGGLDLSPPELLLSGGGPIRLVAQDLDGDRRPELVTLNAWTEDLSIFRVSRSGNVSFEARSGFAGGKDLIAGPGEDLSVLTESFVRRIRGTELPFPEPPDGGGASDCGELEIPGSNPVRLLLVDRTLRFVRGDADRDGRLGIPDAVIILAWLFQGGESGCVDELDADDSGRVTVTDAILILRFLFGGGAPPPEPFPAPGRDPTRDELAACRS